MWTAKLVHLQMEGPIGLLTTPVLRKTWCSFHFDFNACFVHCCMFSVLSVDWQSWTFSTGMIQTVGLEFCGSKFKLKTVVQSFKAELVLEF